MLGEKSSEQRIMHLETKALTAMMIEIKFVNLFVCALALTNAMLYSLFLLEIKCSQQIFMPVKP